MEDASEIEMRRRRATALRNLARDAGTRPEALRVFGSEQALVLAVHQRWQTHLLARLDQLLELGSGDPHADVLRAVEELSRDLPGLAALLREHEDDPALATARHRLAGYVDQACPCGRPHPLVGAGRRPARCAVLRTCTRGARWGRRVLHPPAPGPVRADRLVPRFP